MSTTTRTVENVDCGIDHGWSSCPGHRICLRFHHTSDTVCMEIDDWGVVYFTEDQFRAVIHLANEYYKENESYWRPKP